MSVVDKANNNHQDVRTGGSENTRIENLIKLCKACQQLEEHKINDGTFQHLDLSNCDLNDLNGRALFKALKVNGSVTELNLSSNPIGEEGMKNLCEALKYNSSLQNINLTSTGIDPNTLNLIKQSLEVNSNREKYAKEIEEKQWRRIQVLGIRWKPDKSIHFQFPLSFQEKVWNIMVLFVHSKNSDGKNKDEEGKNAFYIGQLPRDMLLYEMIPWLERIFFQKN
jgi:hypothetical protein